MPHSSLPDLPSCRRLSRLALILPLAFSLLLAAPGWAAGDDPWSVTLKVGQASVDDTFEPEYYGWRADDEDTSASLAIGYQPFRYLGFELAFHDLGSYAGLPVPCEVCVLENGELLVAVHPESVDFTGVSLAAVPRWPITERFELFGKFGFLDWRGDVTPLFTGQSIDDPSDTEVLAGVGARLGITEGLGVQLEYETTDLYDNVSLGASWTF